MRLFPGAGVLTLALVATLPACRSAGPGAGDAAAAASLAPDGAEVRFVHDMIAHHEQALVMSALMPARTAREDLHLLAERITLTQQDEIARMQRWLAERGVAPQPGADRHGGHAMPGMLSATELAQLEQAQGTAFERRFLELMIRHHEGALTMAAQLLQAPGARDPQLYRLVSDIDADQRAEIARMRTLLAALARGS